MARLLTERYADRYYRGPGARRQHCGVLIGPVQHRADSGLLELKSLLNQPSTVTGIPSVFLKVA